MSDLTIKVNECTVNIRVGAIVSKGSRILICRLLPHTWWFLPGGRVKTFESSKEALYRELSEEIGYAFEIIRPIICSENFFSLHGQKFHEICTYYEVQWNGEEEIIQSGEAQEQFKWVERNNICEEDIKPSFLKKNIITCSHELELVIHHDPANEI